MDIIFDERHTLHAGRVELGAGELVPCFEKPDRAEFVLAARIGRTSCLFATADMSVSDK